MVILFGGGGGFVRQSINFQTTTTTRITTSAATTFLVTCHPSHVTIPTTYRSARRDRSPARSGRPYCGSKAAASLYCSEYRCRDGVLPPRPPRTPRSRNRWLRRNHQIQKCARCASSPAPILGYASYAL